MDSKGRLLDTEIKAFTVKFKYVVESEAYVAVAAPDAETAKAGAEYILDKQGHSYRDWEVTSVEEVSSPAEITVN